MSENGTAIKYATICQVPRPDGSICGKMILEHPLNVDIIGEPDARTKNFIRALGEHIHRKHPEAEQGIQQIFAALTQLLLPYLIIRMYKTEDPGVASQAEAYASRLRLISQKQPPSDSEIESAVGKLEFAADDPHREQVVTMLQNMRNYYHEAPPLNPASVSHPTVQSN